MAEEKSERKRQTAITAGIGEILAGQYVVQEGWNPNYVVLSNGKEASRVNIMGIIVDVEQNSEGAVSSAKIDDGSGTLLLRSFDKGNSLGDLHIGHSVLVIGRPRSYGEERYLYPEIIRTLDNPLWLKVRQLEIASSKQGITTNKVPEKEETKEQAPPVPPSQQKGEIITEEIEIGEESDGDKLCEIVKKLDQGNGVDVEVVIKESGLNNSNALIEALLKSGNLFEIGGKLKVLE